MARTASQMIDEFIETYRRDGLVNVTLVPGDHEALALIKDVLAFMKASRRVRADYAAWKADGRPSDE